MLQECRRFTARNHHSIQLIQLPGRPHQPRLRTEFAQSNRMRLKGALQRQHTNHRHPSSGHHWQSTHKPMLLRLGLTAKILSSPFIC